MRTADETYAVAMDWATRFAISQNIDWITGEQAQQSYHAGRWDCAEHLASQFEATSQFNDALAGETYSRIALARGDISKALGDALDIKQYATNTGNDEFLYQALAIETRCYHAAQRTNDALESCSHFLARWQEPAV